MRTARVYTLAAAAGLLLPSAMTGCSKKQTESTTPATASDPVAPPPAAKDPDPMDAGTRTNPVEKVEVLASIEGVKDMMIAASDLSKRVDSDGDGTDILAELQAMLLAQGYGPGFLDSINLDGKHVTKIAFPTDDMAGPDAIDFAATLAVSDGRKVLESMPSSSRPQPLGGEMWELRQDNDTLLIKEAGAELLWGRTQQDVEKATGLLGQAGEGRRLRVKAWNIPSDDIDPADILGLPSDVPIVASISEIAKELKAAEFQLDYGTGKQFEVVGSIDAPFSKLGLDPLGKPRRKATGLEQKLPADPVFVTTLSYGDPAMLNKTLDKLVPIDQIPAPFDTITKDAVKGAHMVLNSVGANVVAALYLDGKGQATVVFAAGLKKNKTDKALSGLRKIHGSATAALEAHATLQGKNKDAKFGVKFKEGGLKFSGIKADQMTVNVPKDFQDELEDVQIFVKKNAIETVSFVDDRIAVWAIGSGARSVASDIARSLGKERKTSMASEGTLDTIRKGMDGCQVCMSFDGREYLRLRLLDMRAKTKDKAQLKTIKGHLAKLAKLDDVEVGAGVRLGDDSGAAGMVVPTATLGLSKETFGAFIEIADFVENPQSATAIETKPAKMKLDAKKK